MSACLGVALLATPPALAHDDEHDDAPADASSIPAGGESATAGAEGATTETPPSAEPQTVVVRVKAHPWSASDTVIDRRQLEAVPRRNGSELLREVPGVYISQHGGEGKAQQIFFRGFDADHGQDVEMWAGGAPVNEVSNLHGQGYADLYFLIPEVVEEIHSQPGTYDPRQGDFAVAGSLGFRLGYAEPGMTLKASAGNFGTRRYLLAYHPEGADSQTFGAFELYATDGFGPSRATQRASAIGQMTHDFGGGVTGRVLATTYSGRFDSAGVLRLDDVESGRIGRFDTYDSKQGGSSSRTSLVLELGREREPESASGVGAPDGWSLAPYLVLRSLSLRSNFTGYLVHPTTGDSVQQVNEATTVGARASYHRTLKLFSAHDALEAGVMLRTDWIRQSQHWLSLIDDSITDSPAHPGVAAKVRATDATGYFSADLHLIRHLSLRGGLRGDGLFYQTEDAGGVGGGQVRSAQGAQLSKRATLDWAAYPGLHALASYGEGFRSPQARSLANGETTPFTRVVSMEAGVRYADRQRLSASAAFYHTRLSDDLVFDLHAEHGVRARDLAETSPIVGGAVELDRRLRLGERVDASLTVEPDHPDHGSGVVLTVVDAEPRGAVRVFAHAHRTERSLGVTHEPTALRNLHEPERRREEGDGQRRRGRQHHALGRPAGASGARQVAEDQTDQRELRPEGEHSADGRSCGRGERIDSERATEAQARGVRRAAQVAEQRSHDQRRRTERGERHQRFGRECGGGARSERVDEHSLRILGREQGHDPQRAGRGER